MTNSFAGERWSRWREEQVVKEIGSDDQGGGPPMDGREWAGCVSEGGKVAAARSKPPEPFEGRFGYLGWLRCERFRESPVEW